MYCTYCGAYNDEDASFCTSCGCALEVEADAKLPHESVARPEEKTVMVMPSAEKEEKTVKAVPSTEKYCTQCGAYNDEDASYCISCGRALTAEADDKPPHDGVARPAENTMVIRRSDENQPGKLLDGQADNKTPYERKRQKKSIGAPSVLAIFALIAAVTVVIVLAIDPFRLFDHSETSQQGSNPLTGDTSSSGELHSDGVLDSNGYEGKSSIVGNLVNGGHMAGDDDGNLYYAAPVDGTEWNTRSIVRCDAYGSNKATVYSAPNKTINVYHLSAIGNKLIFNQVIEGSSTVVCVGVDGSGAKTLDSCDDWSLCQVDNGWVYYLKSGRICRCDLDGGNRTSLASVGSNTYWRIQGDSVYTFSVKGAKDVVVSNLDGSQRSTLYSAPNGYDVRNAFPVDSRKLLVWLEKQSGSGTQLCTVDLGSKDSKSFWNSTGNIERVCAYPDGAIVTRKEPNGSYSIVSVPFSTGKTELDVTATNRGEVRYTSYVLGSIYYGVIVDGTQCSVHIQALEGGGERVVAD